MERVVEERSGGAAFCVAAGTLVAEGLAGSAIFCGVAYPRSRRSPSVLTTLVRTFAPPSPYPSSPLISYSSGTAPLYPLTFLFL